MDLLLWFGELFCYLALPIGVVWAILQCLDDDPVDRMFDD